MLVKLGSYRLVWVKPGGKKGRVLIREGISSFNQTRLILSLYEDKNVSQHISEDLSCRSELLEISSMLFSIFTYALCINSAFTFIIKVHPIIRRECIKYKCADRQQQCTDKTIDYNSNHLQDGRVNILKTNYIIQNQSRRLALRAI